MYDCKPLEYRDFMEFIYRILIGDNGYIGRNLFEIPFVDGIQLIIKLRSNMKGTLMSLSDKRLLKKRAIIETINEKLKNLDSIMKHLKYRIFDNFIVNFLGVITVLLSKEAVCQCCENN